MNSTVVKEAKTNFIEQRKARVAEIVKQHSLELFGYSHATIGEIRSEAIRKNLDNILANY